MSDTYSKMIALVAFTRLRVILVGLVVVFTAGCGSDGGSGTEVVSPSEHLPTDLLLNLRCADVGIYLETCVLEDKENPYRNVATGEFDVNNPGEPVGKLELAKEIPLDSTGAKARFYLWATALARRPSGENQFFTAVALHELWTWQVEDGFGDPLIQEQAIRAYRSVLDNFFGSVRFFSTCDFLNPSPPEPEFFYPVILSDAAGVALVDPADEVTITNCDLSTFTVPRLYTLFPFDPVIAVTAGNGYGADLWVAFVAVTGYASPIAAGFDTFNAKVKGSPDGRIEIKLIGNGDDSVVEINVDSYAGSTDLGDGWYQLSMPFSEFSNAANIPGHTGWLIGPPGDQGDAAFVFLLTDVGFSNAGDTPEFVLYGTTVTQDVAFPDFVQDVSGPQTFGSGAKFDFAFQVTSFPGDIPDWPTPVESQFKAREVLGQWGYSYIEVNEDLVFVTVNN